MKKLLQKYQIALSILLLLILMMGYVIPNKQRKDADKNVASIIQKQIQKDRVLIAEIMMDLREILIINGKKAYENKSLEYQELYKDRFAFYLYENSKLDLWTDNHLPFPSDQNKLSKEAFQKLGAYQVLISNNSFQQFSMIGVQIIKLQYPWQNEFLINHVAPYFKITHDVDIFKNKGSPIIDSDGQQLFSIQLNQKPVSHQMEFLPFVLFLLSFFLLSIILNKILKNSTSFSSIYKLIIFILSIGVWFLLHFVLAIPEAIFQSKLFSPSLFANPWLNISLGHMFFIGMALIAIVIYYYVYGKRRKIFYGWIWVYLLVSFVFFIIVILQIRSLVLDSQVNLNLFQLASLNVHSYVVLWIIFIFQLSWFLLLDRWLGHFRYTRKLELHFWSVITTLGFITFIAFQLDLYVYWELQLIFSLFVLIVFYVKKQKIQASRIGEMLLYIVIITVLTSWYLNDLNQTKEKQIRQAKALNFNLENDPFLEASILKNYHEIAHDTSVENILLNTQIENYDDSLFTYITANYFSDFLNIYNVNLIYCHQNSLINVMPENIETPCYEYFQDRILSAKSVILDDKLYLIDGGFQYYHYIGIINLEVDSIPNSKIYIEFVSKIKPKELGLPAILEKANSNQDPLLRKYSYAIYKDGSLLEWFGKYDYKQKFNDYRLVNTHKFFFDKDGYNHYAYSINDQNTIIISSESPGLLEKFASYAFIFLFYGLIVFFLYGLVFTKAMRSFSGGFLGRLQYSMSVLLLFSFILIGLSSLYYIFYLHQNKNEALLMEKAHSVLIELEHKIGGITEFKANDKEYVEGLLIKFSEVFFTDITLYSRDGQILASSRPEMFTANLLSDRMNAKAYYEMNFLKNSYFIHEETIGSQLYLSAYLPFRNIDNRSVAYLNLPYFAKQYELEEEVSGFIVAFLNIYLLLLFITIIMTIVVSRYLSKPLLLIRDKMQHLDIEQKNEKIEWNRDDEIGELVSEYNRMVDELSLGAKKLAISQRESAWREMAQQIAHEIKNPLTPMMLNVQYLQKAWADGADDYEERMMRITKGLTEQIEVLSNIAGQFSLFASIDKITMQRLNLKTILEDVISIFKANEHISFELLVDEEDYQVFADKNQIIRIFNNIIKNAIQAIGKNQDGKIIAKFNRNENTIELQISDNGCGIDPDGLDNIFEPHFTTKSSGMGLGLALVKKMMENVNGKISVSSKKDMGTIFTFVFPILIEE